MFIGVNYRKKIWNVEAWILFTTHSRVFSGSSRPAPSSWYQSFTSIIIHTLATWSQPGPGHNLRRDRVTVTNETLYWHFQSCNIQLNICQFYQRTHYYYLSDKSWLNISFKLALLYFCLALILHMFVIMILHLTDFILTNLEQTK